MEIIIKEKFKGNKRMDGELITTIMDRNIVEFLLKIKFMDTADIIFFQEHNMKEIGVVV
jgi:hypothetical protein